MSPSVCIIVISAAIWCIRSHCVGSHIRMSKLRKPCYRFEKEVLQHNKGVKSFCNQVWVGWFASDFKKGNRQPNRRGRKAGDCASDRPPEQFSCFLAVGGCQIKTVVEVTDSAALFESSAPFDKDEWHIHISEGDFKALKRRGWDSQICYVEVVPQRGLSRRHPRCQSGCTSFTDALGSGHADCMRYWHGEHWLLKSENVTMKLSNCTSSSSTPAASKPHGCRRPRC